MGVIGVQVTGAGGGAKAQCGAVAVRVVLTQSPAAHMAHGTWGRMHAAIAAGICGASAVSAVGAALALAVHGRTSLAALVGIAPPIG